MKSDSHAAAEILIRHLRLARRTAAEIQDLYSRPLVNLVKQPGVTGRDRA